MPAGPMSHHDSSSYSHTHTSSHQNIYPHGEYPERGYPQRGEYPQGEYSQGEEYPTGRRTGESAASILVSVKQQEAQFEALSRELEAERQSVAHQLEKCKLGSETASMTSISSTDESFHYRTPQGQRLLHQQHNHSNSTSSQLTTPIPQMEGSGYEPPDHRPPAPPDHQPSAPPAPPDQQPRRMDRSDGGEDSDADSKVSGSQLVDSCLRVLQDRGLMNVGHDDRYGYGSSQHVAGEHYETSSTTYVTHNNLISGTQAHSSSPGLYGSHSGNQSPYSNPALYDPVSHRSNSPSESSAAPGYKASTLTTIVQTRRVDSPLAGSPAPYEPNYGDTGGGMSNVSFSSSQPPVNEPHYSSEGNYPEPAYPDSSYPPEASYTPAANYTGNNYGSPQPSGEGFPPGGPMAADPFRDTLPRDPYTDENPYGRAPLKHHHLDDRQTPSPAGGTSYPGFTKHPHEGRYPESHGYTPGLNASGAPMQEPKYDDAPDERSYDGNRSYEPSFGIPNPGYDPSNQSYEQNPQFPGDDHPPEYSSHATLPQHAAPPQDSPYGTYPPQQDEDPYGTHKSPHEESPYDTRENVEPQYSSHQQVGPQYGTPAPDTRDESSYGARDEPSYGARDEPSYGNRDEPSYGTPAHDSSHADGLPPSELFNADEQRWRNPDLNEVIDFLSHPVNAIKANAAAYLQHLCYMDDPVKAKVRSLGGIGALVEHGINNDIPEVHRAACGALRNLSYGRANDENKIAIKSCEGIPALIRLLRKSQDNSVRELVTGILWNLSSCQELKKPIIDDGLTVIVNSVLIAHSGWDRSLSDAQLQQAPNVYWSTVFRNASGIIRNVSSDGAYARTKLRECEGLVDSVFYIIKGAIGKNDIDNKSVENCVCILRNLSFACQEVEDASYLNRKSRTKTNEDKNEATGCFGGNKKRDKKNDTNHIDHEPDYENRPVVLRTYRLLWQPEVVRIYLPLLSDCSNPETLEAAAGAIQNLAACEWEPSALIRAAVRKEKGLPIIVELLSIEADRVVCAAATALRNLALNQRNKELIGKYAIKQLVQKLPSEKQQQDFPTTDQTITAVQATLYEVVRNNTNFTQALLAEGGIDRLIAINRSRNKYNPKVVKFASSLLYTMWQHKELQQTFRSHGWKETDFVTKTMAARGGPSNSADNTLNRPRMDLGGNHATNHSSNHQHNNGASHHQSHDRPTYEQSFQNPNYPTNNSQHNYQPPNHYQTGDELRHQNERDNYGRVNEPIRMDEFPMTSPNYESLERHQQLEHQHPPAGGVPIYPGTPQQQEPLYAQVRKPPSAQKRDGSVIVDSGQTGDGGADSWV